MTNPDRCREEFEKWFKDQHLSLWKAATQATARRCVEIFDREQFRTLTIKKIKQEFGLQEE